MSLHGPDGVILHVNRRLAELLQRPAEELIGESCERVFHGPFTICPHEAALAEGRPVWQEGEIPGEARRRAVTVIPLIEGGRVLGYAREVRDVTAEALMRERLLRAEQYATLGQMMASLAHEIGTPLNIISGYCEYLMMKLAEGAPGYKELSTILEQTRRISMYLRQALDLGRGPQSQRESFSMQGLMEEVLELLGYHLRRQKIGAGLACEAGLGTVFGDATRLRQAFFNLLMNVAARAGEGGRLEVRAEASDAPGGPVYLRVTAQNGAGAAVDLAGLAEGVPDPGLGLALAEAIFAESGVGVRAEEGEAPRGLLVSLPKRAGAPVEGL